MVKVTNLTERTILLHHWKVLPKGSRLLDPRGAEKSMMPDELAYSSAAKRLSDEGVLDLEGYLPPAKIVSVPVVEGPRYEQSEKDAKDE